MRLVLLHWMRILFKNKFGSLRNISYLWYSIKIMGKDHPILKVVQNNKNLAVREVNRIDYG